MITTRRYVNNILRVANSASDESIREGLQWYSEAANIAVSLGRGLKAGAGVLAALSPNKSWPVNVQLAREIAETGVFRGTFAPALKKAEAIWSKQLDPDLVLVGLKERAFYDGIVNRGRTMVVCVDRHAASVAYGWRLDKAGSKLNKTEYRTIAQAYRLACQKLDCDWMPAQLQAVTWVEWRKNK